ncbi:MAG: hypothetical protein HY675_13755 [Chloroflexi bacterium]|nr:hypothetical protein [Chloroflexota bacterium]
MQPEMSARERLDAVIRLEVPDRVPVGGRFDGFLARVAGITMQEYVFDPDKAEAALYKTLEVVGHWDVIQRPTHGGALSFELGAAQMRLPGRELQPDAGWQGLESEVMTVADYDLAIREGFEAYIRVFRERIGVVLDPQEIAATGRRFRENTLRCRAAGLEPICPSNMYTPYAVFEQMRSLTCFLVDLHRHPEKVLAACEACIDAMIDTFLRSIADAPVRRAGFWGTRASPDFVSPRIFAKFYWPHLKKAAFAMIEAGITPVFHLDTNWGPVLHYLRDLPRGKCLVQLDGFTDIFEAKKELGNHMAIMGDLPPTLLTLASPEEVTAYCRKLIEVVGKDGGFVLAAGCCVPLDAKPENVRAMIDAAKTYGRY